MPLNKKLILLGILSYVLISANIGGYSIYILDEAKNAGCAHEMLNTKNLIVPVFNGELRTDKPPLHYYFMITGYMLFGETAFAARFFSAIFGVFTVLLTFVFTRRYLNEKVANFSVLTLLSSFAFVAQFHLATPDPYLIFFITASLYSFFHFDQTGQNKYLYFAYISIGLGILAKGPVAIALPGIAVFFYLLAKRKLQWSEILHLKPTIGALIILLVAAPWYILVHLKTDGAWTQGFFVDHNVDRFAAPREGHGGSFFLPTLFLFGILLPFSVFVPQVVGKAWKNRKSDIILFCTITSISILVFFSFSGTKLPNYVSPIFPFAAILIGYFLNHLSLANKSGLILSLILFLIIGIGVSWGAFSLLDQKKEFTALRHLSLYFIPLPIAGIAGLFFLLLRQPTKAILSISFGFIIFHQCFFYFIYPAIDTQNPVRKSVGIIQEEQNIIYYKSLNPAFIFSLKDTIPKAEELSEVLHFLGSNESAIIISHPKHEKELRQIEGLELLAKHPDLFDTNHVLILKYQNQASPSP